MRQSVLIFCWLALPVFSVAQTPKLAWAKGLGGSSDDNGKSIFADSRGYTYTTGYFSGTVDFDPGTGIVELSSEGEIDIYITKMDNEGNLIWAKGMGGKSSESGRSMVVDIRGNVYVTGYFSDTVDFDPDLSTFTLSSASKSLDIFISKLDSNGKFAWAKAFGGSSLESVGGLSIDALGYIFIVGTFNGSADFDPGTGIFSMTAPAGKSDAFVVKLDGNASFVWAKSFGGSSYDEGAAISTDFWGNAYVTGHFQSVVDFDPGSGITALTSVGDDDIFLIKLNTKGDLVWVKVIGGRSQDKVTSIALDGFGNLFLTGSFYDTADFNPTKGSFKLVAEGSTDIFIYKSDTAGNFSWARRIGGMLVELGAAIGTDLSGNAYVIGNFSENLDFDPGEDTFYLRSAGQSDVFVLKLDPSGKFVWARNMGGKSYDYGLAITVDNMDNIYVTGIFIGSGDFDPDHDSITLQANGYFDVFILKLKTEKVGIYDNSFVNQFSYYPNPASSILTIRNNSDNQKLHVQLLDMSGKVVLSEVLNLTETTIDISGVSDGLYVVRIISEKGVFNGKLLVRY